MSTTEETKKDNTPPSQGDDDDNATDNAGGNAGAAVKDPVKAAEKKAKREAEKKEKAEKIRLKQEKEKEAAAAKAKLEAEGGAKKKEEKKKPSAASTADEAPFVNTTPKGQKKDMTTPMAASYNPLAVEAAWYDYWYAQGFFTPNESRRGRPKYVIVIPPPNVTGSLHLGHALMCAVEDALVRWRRMKGDDVLWVPGTDHAGISTQKVVEARLWAEKKQTRHDLGREEFTKLVWQWKEKYGARICEQLRVVGASLDWSRQAFTMDDNLSRAVTHSFVQFFDDGLIYRADRLVNWCWYALTAHCRRCVRAICFVCPVPN
jgi:valyl-tRNA synthetase